MIILKFILMIVLISVLVYFSKNKDTFQNSYDDNGGGGFGGFGEEAYFGGFGEDDYGGGGFGEDDYGGGEEDICYQHTPPNCPSECTVISGYCNPEADADFEYSDECSHNDSTRCNNNDKCEWETYDMNPMNSGMGNSGMGNSGMNSMNGFCANKCWNYTNKETCGKACSWTPTPPYCMKTYDSEDISNKTTPSSNNAADATAADAAAADAADADATAADATAADATAADANGGGANGGGDGGANGGGAKGEGGCKTIKGLLKTNDTGGCLEPP